MNIGIDSTKLRAKEGREIYDIHNNPLSIGTDIGTQGVKTVQF